MNAPSGRKSALASLKTHLRLIVIAVFLGLAAYGAIHLLIWLFKLVNLM